MTDKEYKAARRRVRQKRNFFRWMAFYAVMTVVLAVINLLTWPGTLWFPWAMLGFGVDLIVKYLQVFGFPGGVGSEDWADRELENEIRRLESGRSEEEGLELRELEKPRRKAWNDDELVECEVEVEAKVEGAAGNSWLNEEKTEPLLPLRLNLNRANWLKNRS